MIDVTLCASIEGKLSKRWDVEMWRMMGLRCKSTRTGPNRKNALNVDDDGVTISERWTPPVQEEDDKRNVSRDWTTQATKAP